MTIRLIAIATVLFGTASQAGTPAGWPVTRVSALGFSEAFPANPKVVSKVDDGVHLTTYSGSDSGLFCSVTVGDYPEKVDPEAAIADERDGFLKGFNGKLGANRRIDFYRGSTALPATEFEVSNDRAALRVLVIVDGARDYVVVGGARADSARAGQIHQCLDGFTLLPQ